MRIATCWRCGAENQETVVDPVLQDTRDSIGIGRCCYAFRYGLRVLHIQNIGTGFRPVANHIR